MRAGPSRHRRPPAGVRAARRRSRWSTPRLNDLDRRRAVCSARPGRRGRDGPRPHPSRLRPEAFARARSISEPEAPPEAFSCLSAVTVRAGARGPAGRSARTTAPAASTSAGAAGVPGITCSTTRDSDRGDDRADGQPQRPAAADPRREVHQGQQRLPRRRRRLVVAGDHRDRRGDRPVRPVGQVGVGLGPAPRGAELGVGGRRGGVPGQVPAVGPVRVGGRGDLPPGGADLLVGQVGAFGQAERRERVRVRCSSGVSGVEEVIQAARPRPRIRGGIPARLGRRGRGRRWAGGGQQGERGGPGPGDLDEGGRAALDVAGLADLQAADQVGVGGPGVLLAGGALIAPRVRR